MMTDWFVLIRAIHFGACLLFFGVFAFDRFVAVSVASREPFETGSYWKSLASLFRLITLPVIVLSGISWFVSVAATMSGLPITQALRIDVLRTVWSQTQFGTVWQFRLLLWLVCIILAVVGFLSRSRHLFRAKLIWVELLFSGCLLASLAWAGHGQEGQPAGLHLFADVLHLLVAGIWPAGLLPFSLLLQKLRHSSDPARWQSIAILVRRFSAFSLGGAAVLAMTGFVNSWSLVGSVRNLFQQPYGRLLLLKIVLFGLAVGIGAMNLLRLKPRLMAVSLQGGQVESACAQWQFNVQLELFLGMIIVVVVAVLGIMPPAFP
jgi:copper resistance protein D